MAEDDGERPDSLLPYDDWTEEALRLVAVRALQHAAREGLPGDHHFYLTFRTDFAGAAVPSRLRAQYPQEMTIILQHQYWDLKVDETSFSVGLSFGGVPTTLVVPFAALTAFADPHVRYGLRFRVAEPDPAGLPAARPLGLVAVDTDDTAQPAAKPDDEPEPEPERTPPDRVAEEPQVVSLDAFRRRPTPKD